jgi:hypothetical protein
MVSLAWTTSFNGDYHVAASRLESKCTDDVTVRSWGSTPTGASSRLQKKVNPINNTTFILFDKYYLIVDQLGSKDLSRDF